MRRHLLCCALLLLLVPHAAVAQGKALCHYPAKCSGVQTQSSASYYLTAVQDLTASLSTYSMFEVGTDFDEVSGTDPRNEWIACPNITDRAAIQFTRSGAVQVPIRVTFNGTVSLNTATAETSYYNLLQANEPVNDAAMETTGTFILGVNPMIFVPIGIFAPSKLSVEMIILMDEGDCIAAAIKGDGSVYNYIFGAGSGITVSEVGTPPLS